MDNLASLGNIMVTLGHRPGILSTFLHFIWAPVHFSAYFLCYKNLQEVTINVKFLTSRLAHFQTVL